MIEPSPRPAPAEWASLPAEAVLPVEAGGIGISIGNAGGNAGSIDGGLGEGLRVAEREPVEMMAHFRRGIASTTVMLKDLTPFGARVEGVGALEVDEMITLSLPGCRPSLAFVAWANAHCAGLEFVEPLPAELFADLVAHYGMSAAGSDGMSGAASGGASGQGATVELRTGV
ncbi:hypothetical protein [Novosphingobium silvae]|uniref:hypothetical protein n=1 Tax=Novosphingobium silvae TaxID=2692619 RepID=UPI001F3EF3CB|nr:hypothetical protein [Novosphingobium silvae]